jgi:hypothetical protein
MLSEAKHLWFFPTRHRSQKKSEIESLVSRTSSAALQLHFAQNDICEIAVCQSKHALADR